MFTLEDNKRLMRQFALEFNSLKDDFAKIRALHERFLAPNYVGNKLLRGDMNRELIIQYVVITKAATRDLNYSDEDIIAKGNKVITRYTA